MLPASTAAVDDQQPRAVPRLERVLRDQVGREVEVELRCEHGPESSPTEVAGRENIPARGETDRGKSRTILGRFVRLRRARILPVESITVALSIGGRHELRAQQLR